MIYLNGEKFEPTYFPDGTQLLKVVDTNASYITWKYENEKELLTIIYIAKHLKERGNNNIRLYLGYVPNARMDRIKSVQEVFTLKYFCEMINGLGFEKVYVFDPHSTVCAALLDRVHVLYPQEEILEAMKNIPEEAILCYPDEGSCKRYSSIFKHPHVFGIKKRNWEDGKIVGLDIIDNGIDLKNSTVLIVDDICSYGGTFLHCAKKLKELGVGDIYLYVSHCENSILDGELIKSGLLKHVFTTNTIFSKEHPLITVL